jgi:hypothetical protein
MAGSAWGIGGRHGVRRLLLPFDFGEPVGDMGMMRLERTGLVKGGARFIKLARPQQRIPVRKRLEY